jgi:hypothetical protein
MAELVLAVGRTRPVAGKVGPVVADTAGPVYGRAGPEPGRAGPRSWQNWSFFYMCSIFTSSPTV